MIPSLPLAKWTAPRTKKPMADFEQSDIVRVPFLYPDKDTRQHSPGARKFQPEPSEKPAPCFWVVMITAAENRELSGDVAIPDDERTGLPVPSVVRPCKIA